MVVVIAGVVGLVAKAIEARWVPVFAIMPA